LPSRRNRREIKRTPGICNESLGRESFGLKQNSIQSKLTHAGRNAGNTPRDISFQIEVKLKLTKKKQQYNFLSYKIQKFLKLIFFRTHFKDLKVFKNILKYTFSMTYNFSPNVQILKCRISGA